MSIVSLFDMSGYSLRDWAVAGEECFCLDIVNRGRRIEFGSGGSITFPQWDAKSPEAKSFVLSLLPIFLFSFAPCTDLAVSGAKHFKAKREANPTYLVDSLEFVLLAPAIAAQRGCGWVFENPVGQLSSLWQPPRRYFDPCDFGGYLPEHDIHPEWPQYIPPRDAYLKKTCIWGEGWIWPQDRRVPYIQYVDLWGNSFSPQTALLGGKSEKTKQIRSATPRGWARAFFLANYSRVTSKPLPF